jgi:hypothetical protein
LQTLSAPWRAICNRCPPWLRALSGLTLQRQPFDAINHMMNTGVSPPRSLQSAGRVRTVIIDITQGVSRMELAERITLLCDALLPWPGGYGATAGARAKTEMVQRFSRRLLRATGRLGEHG